MAHLVRSGLQRTQVKVPSPFLLLVGRFRLLPAGRPRRRNLCLPLLLSEVCFLSSTPRFAAGCNQFIWFQVIADLQPTFTFVALEARRQVLISGPRPEGRCACWLEVCSLLRVEQPH